MHYIAVISIPVAMSPKIGGSPLRICGCVMRGRVRLGVIGWNVAMKNGSFFMLRIYKCGCNVLLIRNATPKEHIMVKATDAQIITFIKGMYRGQFNSMAVSSIETGSADKYGTVKHTIFAHTVWYDNTETDNAFTCSEDKNGYLR